MKTPALALKCVLSLLLWGALAATPAAAAEPAASFGSAALLHGLWTSAQLAGTEADRSIGAVTAPDTTPPPTLPPEQMDQLALPPVRPELRGVIRRVRVSPDGPGGGRKVVALTFDLCERANNVAGYDNRIINLLRAGGHKATFFAGGKWMRSHPEKAMQLMADPRFELGSHTWTHGNLALMDQAQIRAQMEPTQVQYALLRQELGRRAEARALGAQMALVPKALPFMRLPYGRSSALALEELARSGYPAIQWDVEGERDEEVHSPASIARTGLSLIRSGSIVLMHANAVPEKTFAVLPRVLKGLRKRGFELVTVSELLRLGPVETVAEGYFSEPGDNLQYDALFPGKGTLKPDRTRPFTTVPVP
ncbi:MAG: polysaccharide deacetylase family protein [Humidesulfovibrio sp.]|uniref:polysaccharide deacetylase family protein n=1 Tax=Humidesulfovibrio sp. TaxID=2910988 RepID=UPI0027EB7532|nr:polysaccharide deacetylase family protein [Humidesulfovibrio sp.]MDQ7834613.1 polysaccharide deacetylase family protein [Humidesulfovibrio sp.]